MIKRQNGHGGIERTKNGNYRIRVYDIVDGNRKRITLKNNIKSKKEAERMLEEYYTNPWDLDIETMTLEELFEQFYKEKTEPVIQVAEDTLNGYKYDFKRCRPLHKEKFKNLKVPQLQNFINNLNASDGTKNKTKFFLVQLYEFGMRMEYVRFNKAKSIKIYKRNDERIGNIFTDEEIKKLWKYVEVNNWIDVILIMIYTGYRIGEIVSIKKENVDLENGLIKGGNKTKKGKNRIVPIREEIYELVQKRYMTSKTNYLVDNKEWKILNENRIGMPIRKNYLREQFYKVMDKLNMKHRPHDTRKTLATLMRKNDINDSIILDIMGHTKIDTTRRYYIKNDFKTLKSNMERLSNHSKVTVIKKRTS
jgi:putative integrase-recombinase protein